MTKVHPERVIPELAQLAMADCKVRTEAYTHYILRHYRATGDLAPGCDARDLIAWLEQNMTAELAAKTRPTKAGKGSGRDGEQ